jgi:D-Tyr-tRNAtyr deacylase
MDIRTFLHAIVDGQVVSSIGKGLMVLVGIGVGERIAVFLRR